MLGLALICVTPLSVSAACAAIWGSTTLAAEIPLPISMRRRVPSTFDIGQLPVCGKGPLSLGPDCRTNVANTRAWMATAMIAITRVATATFDDAGAARGAEG